ncbi:hypothetical protein IAI18_07595 [Acetobacteraceae bacterium H6797]|nr:hypothetical protein [Acetobacteraceae bacterium H6797]
MSGGASQHPHVSHGAALPAQDAAIVRAKAALLARMAFAEYGEDTLAPLRMAVWLNGVMVHLDRSLGLLGPVTYRRALLALYAESAWREWERLHEAAAAPRGGLH